MKKVPITLSLPENLVKDLHLYVSRRQISKFVTQMVENGLKSEKERWAQEFREASEDKERKTEIELWDTLIDEGLDEKNNY